MTYVKLPENKDNFELKILYFFTTHQYSIIREEGLVIVTKLCRDVYFLRYISEIMFVYFISKYSAQMLISNIVF